MKKNRELKKSTGRDGGQTLSEKEKKIPGSGTIEFQS
jgi:hypothetical protein